MGSDWCSMRIQWASMDGPGVGVNALSASALVSVWVPVVPTHESADVASEQRWVEKA